jgi:hypothetical protein
MTAHLRYDMTCDGPDCAATFTIGTRQATPMRAAAAVVGWTSGADPMANRSGPVKTVDLCPDCSTKARP